MDPFTQGDDWEGRAAASIRRRPTRYVYRPGMTVLVEGVVIDYEAGLPYGAVLVDFPAATDEAHDADGVAIWTPQAMVSVPAGSADLTEYVSTEGFYPKEDND